MNWVLAGAIGFFIGTLFGVMVMAVCAASGAAHRKEEEHPYV